MSPQQTGSTRPAATALALVAAVVALAAWWLLARSPDLPTTTPYADTPAARNTPLGAVAVADRPLEERSAATREAVDAGPDSTDVAAGAETETTMRLRVRLFDDTPAPAGTVVGLIPDGGFVLEHRLRTAVVDDAGIADFGAFDAGIWSVIPSGDTVAAVAGRANEHDIQLRGYIAVRGRVLGAGTAPVAGATILARYYRDRPLMQFPVAVSDHEGRFDFTVKGPMNLFLIAHRPDLVPSAQEFVRTAMLTKDSPLPGPQPLVLRMGQAASGIDGVCLDAATGKPLPGALIRAVGAPEAYPAPTGDLAIAMGSPPGLTEAGPTDATGRFALDGLPAGQTEVVAWLPGRSAPTGVVVEVPPPPGRAQVRIAVPAGATAQGTLRDAATGEPVAGARIGTRLAAGAAVTATSDAEGRFVIEHLPPGSFDVRIGAESYPVATETLVSPGAGTFPWNVTLAPGLSVSSRLVSQDGAPVANARVVWIDGGGVPVRFTDADGRFAFTGIAEKPFRLLVRVGDDQPITPFAGEHPRELPAEIRLPARSANPGLVGGRVVDARGEPIAGAIAMLWGLDGNDSGGLATTQADGRFQIDDVEPATWRLMVRLDNHPTVHVAGIVVPAGRPVDLGDLVVPVTVPFAAVLDLPPGVTTDPVDGEAWRAYVVHADGTPRSGRVHGNRVSMPPLGPGHYRIDVVPPHLPPTGVSFELIDGPKEQIVLVPITADMRSAKLEVRTADRSRTPTWVVLQTFDASGQPLQSVQRMTSRLSSQMLHVRRRTTRLVLTSIDGTWRGEAELPQETTATPVVVELRRQR